MLTPDGWYKSGDVFRRDEAGCYRFVGRTDDMFVCGGENIFPSEVESCAGAPSRRRAGVRGAGAGRDQGHEAGRFCGACGPARILTRTTSSASRSPMRRRTSIRARVFFVAELPLAGTNKVDRKALWSSNRASSRKILEEP